MTAIRPRLVAVWLTLGVLVAAIFAFEYNERSGDRTPATDDARMLLPVPVAKLGAIEVGQAGTLHRFERDHDGAWLHHGAHAGSDEAHEHHADPAKAELIAKAFAALERARIERRFPLEAAGARYGLGAPAMLLVIYRMNEPHPFAQYAIGDVAPDSFSRYVLKVGSNEVVTIANYQIENLVKLIEAMRK